MTTIIVNKEERSVVLNRTYPTGKSAYELAVDYGYTGTEEEWVELQQTLADEAAASATTAVEAATSASLAVVPNPTISLQITNKGNGDTITHTINANCRILTFYNDLDGGRQMNNFYCNTITPTSFILRNDFTDDKFSGMLILVKTDNIGFSYPPVSDKLNFQSVMNFDDIGSSLSARAILVMEDETNGNQPTFYLHDGANLNWVITQQI